MIYFDPRWVWIYSGLYYPMILLAALVRADVARLRVLWGASSRCSPSK
jgi:hypothetical protein